MTTAVLPGTSGRTEPQTSQWNGLFCVFLKFDILIKAFLHLTRRNVYHKLAEAAAK